MYYHFPFQTIYHHMSNRSYFVPIKLFLEMHISTIEASGLWKAYKEQETRETSIWEEARTSKLNSPFVFC